MTTLFIAPHKKIGYLFAVLTIIALLLTIYGLLQGSYQANIIVYSQRTKTEINITETVAAKILEQTLSGNQTFAPKTIATMDDFATGEVTIINNSSQNLKLVAPTRLLSADNKLSEIVIGCPKGDFCPIGAFQNAVTQNLTITGAVLSGENKIVTLTTAETLTADDTYRVIINNVEDTSGNIIETGTTEIFVAT